MKEFKGKCEFVLLQFCLGLLFTIAFFAVSILFILHGDYWVLIFMALLIFASTQIFLYGLSDLIYTGKIVLKIYDDRLEFICNKRFNRVWQSCEYNEITEFEVIRNGYVVNGTKEVNKNSGHIYFKFGNDYCWVNINNCFMAAEQILINLNDNQISSNSELKIKDINKN